MNQLTADGSRRPVRGPLSESQRALLVLTWVGVLASCVIWWPSRDVLIDLLWTGYFQWERFSGFLIYFTPPLIWPAVMLGGAVQITLRILRSSALRWFDKLLAVIMALGLLEQAFLLFILGLVSGLGRV